MSDHEQQPEGEWESVELSGYDADVRHIAIRRREEQPRRLRVVRRDDPAE